MTDLVVSTDLGAVRGRGRGGVVRFAGIPYAAAPEGPLRFRAPAPPEAWDGVRDAVEFGTAPPQLRPAPGVPPIWRPGDGLDCLTLNVWSPDLGAAGLPVLVWIYGGLWRIGATSMPQYDATALAAAGVVVVTINYRIGFEGFGHLPGAPDNRGLRDQIAALEWVRRNIAAFGGDPDRVTVFGQSAGAASVALLTAAAPAGDLFRRAIAQSIPAGHRTVKEAGRVTAAVAAAAGVPATWEGFAALPPEAILAVQDVPPVGAGRGAFGPVSDCDLVVDSPWITMTSIARNEVDLICGYTHEEYRGMAPPGPLVPKDVDLTAVAASLDLDADYYLDTDDYEVDDGVDYDAYDYDDPDAAAAHNAAHNAAYLDAYNTKVFVTMMSDGLVRLPTTRVAWAHAGTGGRTWLYDLAWDAPAVGAGHGIDVPLVFGNPDTRYAARLLGSPPPADFPILSEAIRRAWIAFATTGDPGWPRFAPDHAYIHVWDNPPRGYVYE